MRQNQDLHSASKAAFDKAFNACLMGIDVDHPAAGEVVAGDVLAALDKAGFEIVRKPQPGSTDGAPAVTRDLVLFNCEDYEGNDLAAEALGLGSYPLGDAVTLGWLIDEHGAYRRSLETLFWDLTNGCVSKPDTSLDVVHELAGKAFIVNLLEEHPALAEDPLFRPAMEQHFDAREISAAVEVARLRLDGNRVVRVGTIGTFNLGKATA